MAEAAGDSILLSVAGSVATIRLNRPATLNAFTAAMHADLRAAFDRVEEDTHVAVLVLTGAGRGFCAGQDLGERASAFERGEPPDLGASLADNYNPLITRLAALPYPTIAAVNGIASGAGAALAIACDIVLAARSARFQFGFGRVGLGPDSGASWSLPRRVGPARAAALFLTGEPVDAERAYGLGLCDRVTPDEELVAEANSIASALANGPGETFTLIKRMMQDEAPDRLETALEREAETQRELGAHPNYREAVTAFAAKRKPEFK